MEGPFGSKHRRATTPRNQGTPMIHASNLRRLAFVLLAGAACSGDGSPSARMTAPSTSAPTTWDFSSASLIQCPTNTPLSTTGIIGPLGGLLAVGNTLVIIPANAVLAPTSFTLTVPTSQYVEIAVDAAGTDHFVFAAPVTVVIAYGRCNRANINSVPLTAWNIDPVTKALLEQMPSVDDKLFQTVTFTTIHFSGYAVAD
jgi:hypothetical protein